MKGSKGIAASGRKSYVYLIRCAKHVIYNPLNSVYPLGGYFYKIGIAYNLQSRLSSLQCGNPFRLDLVCAVLADNAKGLERELHEQYIDSNHMREWFALSDFDSRAIIEAMRNQGGVLYAIPSNL